jgi:hypothetical protein
MNYGVIQAYKVATMKDKGSSYYNNAGNLGSVYYLSSVNKFITNGVG